MLILAKLLLTILSTSSPEGPTSLIGGMENGPNFTPILSVPAPAAWSPLPLGALAPQGWLLEQLVRQANALSGFMPTSTFPGAIDVNTSLWVGGNLTSGTDQWLPVRHSQHPWTLAPCDSQRVPCGAAVLVKW